MQKITAKLYKLLKAPLYRLFIPLPKGVRGGWLLSPLLGGAGGGFWLLVLLTTHLHAQEFAYKKYTIRDGIPQSQVLAIAQDEQDNIWFSTKGGLSKFDGKQFHNIYEKDGLPRMELWFIIHFNKNNIFFARDKQQPYIYNGKTFKPVKLPAGYTFYYAEKHHKTGTILAALSSDSLKQSGLFKLVNDSFQLFQPITYRKVKWIGPAFWTGSRLNDFWLMSGEDEFSRVLERYENGKMTATKQMHKFSGAARSKSGYLFYEGKSQKLYNTPDETKLIDSLPFSFNELIRTVAIDDLGNLFVANRQKLYVKLKGTHSLIQVPVNFTLINTIMVDKHNQLWVADEGALYKFHHFAFSHFNEKQGLGKNIWSVVEDSQGNYWMAGYESGLFLYDNYKFQNLNNPKYLPKNPNSNFYVKDFYMGAARDWKGRIWFPVNDYVTIANPTTKSATILPTPDHTMLYLHPDFPQKRMYLCGTRGVYVVDENLRFVDSIPKGKLFPGNVIFAMQAGINSRGEKIPCKWFGNFRNIACMEGERIDTGFYNQLGKPVAGVCMAEDKQGNIWMGSKDGLTQFNGKTFYLHTTPPFNVSISSLLQYDDSTLYVGLNDGLAIINTAATHRQRKLVYRILNEHNGFLGIETGQNGIMKDSKGYVWVTTTDYVTRIDPRLLPAVNRQLNTTIQAAYIQDENYNWKLHRQTANQYADTLPDEIPYSSKRVKFSFGAIHHTAPENTRFIYRLDGFDEKWSQPSHEGEAIFTHLPPGSYSFRVRAAQEGEFTADNEAILYFTITTPFYIRWWFKALCVLSFLALTAIIAILIYRKRKQKAERELRLQLEQSALQHQALRAQIEPHFAANVLNSINESVLNDNRMEASRNLAKFSKLVRDSLQLSDVLYHSLESEISFIQNHLDVEKRVLKERLKYEIKTESNVNMGRVIPVMLLHTFVENSIKHAIKQYATGGKIEISLSNNGSETLIQIRDIVAKETSPAPQPGTRKGISIIEKIIQLHNHNNTQKMTVNISDSTQGRTVTISIPHGYNFNTSYSKS